MTSKSSCSTRKNCLVLASLTLCMAGGIAAQEAAVAPATGAQPIVGYTDLLPNGVEPVPGVVAGGQPTLEQLDEAAARGLKTVINLRGEGESDIGREEVEARGMAYVALPIEGVEALTAENASALDAALAAAEQPVMVHCGSGNRVGALFALRAYYVEGASAEEALAFGATAGMTKLTDATREVIAAGEQASPPID